MVMIFGVSSFDWKEKKNKKIELAVKFQKSQWNHKIIYLIEMLVHFFVHRFSDGLQRPRLKSRKKKKYE